MVKMHSCLFPDCVCERSCQRVGGDLANWDGKRCPFCLVVMTIEGEDLWRKPTRDHLTPKSRDGTDAPANILVVCALCNHQKKNLTL